MPKVSAQVNWDPTTNGPVVSPNPIPVPSSNGATDIEWTAGPDIASFQITNLNTTEFTDQNSTDGGKKFKVKDKNNAAGTYSYSVTATHASGLTGCHDPDIENGSGLP